jgi:hypothetical protein
MGRSKDSPATQMLEWAVGKIDEASKTDWVEKFNSLTASKPAYLRAGFTASSPSLPAPAPAGAGVNQAELDAALTRAAQAESRADGLARRVKDLEGKLAATNSHPREVLLPDDEAALAAGDEHDDDEHKSHWWSRKH